MTSATRLSARAVAAPRQDSSRAQARADTSRMAKSSRRNLRNRSYALAPQEKKESRRKRARPRDAEVVVPVDGGEPKAGGRAETHWIVVKGPAADHATIAIAAGDPCRPVRRSTRIAVMIAILQPLPHIAMNLEEPPGIRLKRIDRNCFPPILPH